MLNISRKINMASEKNKENEQSAIDNLNSHLTTTGERLANNKKIIYWGVGIIAAVAVLVCCYLFLYHNPRVNNSWDAYNKVMLQVNKGELTDSASAVAYKNVAEKYSGTDAASVAALSAAESFYDLGKYDEAIKMLDKFSTSEPVIDAMSSVLLGDCYVNKGAKFYDQALSAYGEALKKADNNPQIAPAVLIKEANIYDAKKDYAKALSCYEQIKAGYPQFQFGNGMTVEAYIEREKARTGK